MRGIARCTRGRWGRSSLHQSRRERQPRRGASQQRNLDCFPMSMRNRCDQPLSARATTSEPHHVYCLGSGLVDKHQPSGVKHALLSYPTSAGASDIGWLLALPRAGFFLKLTLCRSKKRWRALRLPEMPCLAMAARKSPRGSNPVVWRPRAGSSPSALPIAKHSRRSVSAPRSLSHSSVGAFELPN